MPASASPDIFQTDLTEAEVTSLVHRFQDRLLRLAMKAAPGSIMRNDLLRAACVIEFRPFDRTGGIAQVDIEDILADVRAVLGDGFLNEVVDMQRHVWGLRCALERMLFTFDDRLLGVRR